jgi:hypothetical protein
MSVPRLPHAADEPTFDAEKPDIVRPMIGASLDVMAALLIRAINHRMPRMPEVRSSARVIFWW